MNQNHIKTKKLSLENLRQEAKVSMGEVEQLIPTRISELRTLLQKDKELYPHPSAFDEFYLRCIRAKKYDIVQAANLYRRFCRLRTGGGGDFMNKLHPSCYSNVLYSNFFSTLKTRDDLGRLVVIIRAEKWIAHEVSLDDILLAMFFFMDELMASEDTQLLGIVAIADTNSLSFGHVKLMSPWRIQTFVKFCQDAYPLRIKELHIINSPKIFTILYGFAKTFLKEKMKKRVHIHGYDMSSLIASVKIDARELPLFLGGGLSEEEFFDDGVVQQILKKDSYYEEFLKYGYVSKPTAENKFE